MAATLVMIVLQIFLGNKFVIGRTSIGAGSQCAAQGLEHWMAMTATLGQVVEKSHKLS